MKNHEGSTRDYVAIFDIGSNAVRLVVYDGLNRAPVKIHNERNLCSLGADLATTGKLSPEGVRKALDSLRRFAGLVESMRIKTVRAVATAAVRDAKDGEAFIEKVRKEFGIEVYVIEGEEEARLSAAGVIANGLGEDGLIGDYGGGSLELIAVEKGKVKHKMSLPLGSHRLHVLPSRAQRIKVIDEYLDTVPFLEEYAGTQFCALGGSWRSMAKAHMNVRNHPLRILDHYTIGGKQALEFAEVLSRQSVVSLEKAAGLSRKRIKDMAVAALVMERLFLRLKPSSLVFSGSGLREGLLFDQLPASLKKQDPLLTSCRKTALKISRFADLRAFETLYKWMLPLFEDKREDIQKWVHAACYLSDSGWFEHEDYQAQHAFQRALVLPYYGMTHEGRVFVALAEYVRYQGEWEKEEDTRTYALVKRMLDEKTRNLAILAGMALHAGYLLCGGALGLLKDSELDLSAKSGVVLKMNSHDKKLNADVVTDVLEKIKIQLTRC